MTEPQFPRRWRPAPAGALERVVAAGRRRRRRAMTGAVGGAAALLLVTGLLVANQPDTDRQSIEVATPPPTAEPTPTATSPTPTMSPTPTQTTPPASPTAPARPSPTPSPTESEGFNQTHTDGKDGWSTGFTACASGGATLPPFDPAGLTLRLTLFSTVYRSDDVIRAHLRIANNTAMEQTIDVVDSGDDGTLIDGYERAWSGVHSSDALAVQHVVLPAGHSMDRRVTIRLQNCGDGPDDAAPLKDGSYFAAAVLHTNGPSATYWSNRVGVTVDASAPANASINDGKDGWSMNRGGCGSGEAKPADDGPPQPGLTLTVELPRTNWAPGEEIRGFLVVRNVGPTEWRRESSRFGQDGMLLSDASDRGVSARYMDLYEQVSWAVPPGGTQRHQAIIRTHRCGDGPGEAAALPAGNYRLAAFLIAPYEDNNKISWVAPEVTVQLG